MYPTYEGSTQILDVGDILTQKCLEDGSSFFCCKNTENNEFLIENLDEEFKSFGVDRCLDDSGKVIFNGIDLKEIPPEKRGIGMVFQNLALFPHLNVYDNLKFGLPSNSSNTRISEILDLVGLKEFESRRIQNLSGGEAQRVALARSLIAKPKMILLDEPLSSLDSHIKEALSIDVRKMIKSLSIPAIYVTHDPIIANKMADRVIYLENENNKISN